MKHQSKTRCLMILLTVFVMAFTAGCGGNSPPTEEPVVTEESIVDAPEPTAEPMEPTLEPVEAANEETRPEGKTGGTLIIAQEQEPASMMLAESSTPVSAQFYTALLNNEPLLRVDHEFNVVPGILAEVPTLENGGISPDFRVFTLTLRPDLLWDDGSSLTAEDIRFTFEWLNNPDNTPYATHGWERVESVDVSDDGLTATITLKEPYAFFMSEAVIGMGIVPKEAMDRLGSKVAYNQMPVGNGPFKVVEWVVGDHLTFERNDLYFRGPAYLDGVIVKFIPDTNALLAQQLAGDVHVGLGFIESAIPQLQAEPNLNVIRTDWPYMERINFSQTVPGDTTTPHPILTDLNVRKALAFAIDKESLVKNLFYGVNVVAVNELQGTPWFNKSLKPYPYDPEESIRLLEESGWFDEDEDGIREKDGVRLSVTYSTTSGNRTREAIQSIIQANAADIGMDLVIENYPPPKLFGGWSGILWGRQYELGQFANGIFTFDPNYGSWWHSSSIPTPEKPYGNGHTGWSNERLDEILAEHMAGVSPERAKEILDEAQQIVYDNVPMIPLYQRETIFVTNKVVKNVNPTTFGALSGFFWEPYNWSLDQ